MDSLHGTAWDKTRKRSQKKSIAVYHGVGFGPAHPRTDNRLLSSHGTDYRRTRNGLVGSWRQDPYRQESGSSQDSNSTVDWGHAQRGRSRDCFDGPSSSAGLTRHNATYDHGRSQSAWLAPHRASEPRMLSVRGYSIFRSRSRTKNPAQKSHTQTEFGVPEKDTDASENVPSVPGLSEPTYESQIESFGPTGRVKYLHEPLRFPRRQFRLVRVLSSGDGPNDPIVCDLRTFDIKDRYSYGSYTALSYTWGFVESTHPIYLTHGARHHAEAFNITRNLYHILKHIRESADKDANKRWSGWWWIDSVCILQDKLQDKNNENRIQIGIMRQIYRNAAEVYAWIGEDNQVTSIGMSFIKKTGSKRLETDDNGDPQAAYQMIQDSIEDIFKKDYWSRLWILQELAVSRKTTLACGDKEVPWTSLIGFGTEVATWKAVPQDAHIRKRQYVWLISKIYQQDPNRLDLAALVFLSEHAECSEPQDYILALLGLVAPGRGRSIRPEESGSPCRILSRAVRIMILDQPKTLRRRYKELAYKGHDHQCSLLEDPDNADVDCAAATEHLDICRKLAAEICEGKPLLVDILPSQERWRFYRNRMVRDKSRTRGDSTASVMRHGSTRNK